MVLSWSCLVSSCVVLSRPVSSHLVLSGLVLFTCAGNVDVHETGLDDVNVQMPEIHIVFKITCKNVLETYVDTNVNTILKLFLESSSD